jgi:hypothetical protein
MKKQILKILRQIFVKEKKEIPLGVEAAGLDMQAEKIARELSDVGYRGPISIDFIKRIQQASKPTYERVWPKQSADVLDMTGKKIHPDETIIGGKGYKVDEGGIKGIEERMDKIKGMSDELAKLEKEKSAMYGKKPTEAELKSKLEGMNKKTVDRIRRRRYEAARKAEREKMAKDPDYLPKIIDPDDFAGGGLAGMLGERTGYGIGNWVKENIPPEYRLYAKSILPGGESGKVGSDYFPESFKRELRAQALDKYKRTGELTGQVGEREQHRGDPTINKLLQFPSTYASLGTYTYDIDPKTMDVRVTDKYDWNPDYGTRKILGEEMTGWHKPTRSFKGQDVDLGMFKQLAKESWKNKSIDKANLLEMVGNYFGGKESEGKGFDVDIDIPTKEATSATEGSFAGGGLAPLLGEPTYADGGRIGFQLGGGGIDDSEAREYIKQATKDYYRIKPKMSLDTFLMYRMRAFADGGRIGFKGKKFDPTKRTFLKGIGALAALPIVGKYFKWAKPLAKTVDLTSVPIKNIDDMPYWFKPLVNKVIKEGTEVSSGAERVIVHKTKLPNSKTDVYVTQELDTGHVAVEIGQGKHGFADGHLGQPVRLEYRASEWIEPTINTKTQKVIHKGQKTKPEFNVEEAEFTGGHPENVKFEESTIEKFGEHGSNFDEVEKFATGKVKKTKPLKKAEQLDWARGRAEAEADTAADLADDLDFASGGRVPLAYGSDPSFMSLNVDEDWDAEDPDHWELIKKLLRAGEFGAAEGGRVPLAGGKGVLEGLMKLANKISPKSTKIGQTSKTMAEKTQLKRALADFQERQNITKELESFRGKVDDNIIKEISAMEPAQQLKAIEDVKLYLRNMKNLRQETTLREFDIKGQKGHAFGGRVSLSNGGLAGMLGE